MNFNCIYLFTFHYSGIHFTNAPFNAQNMNKKIHSQQISHPEDFVYRSVFNSLSKFNAFLKMANRKVATLERPKLNNQSDCLSYPIIKEYRQFNGHSREGHFSSLRVGGNQVLLAT